MKGIKGRCQKAGWNPNVCHRTKQYKGEVFSKSEEEVCRVVTEGNKIMNGKGKCVERNGIDYLNS